MDAKTLLFSVRAALRASMKRGVDEVALYEWKRRRETREKDDVQLNPRLDCCGQTDRQTDRQLSIRRPRCV